MCLNTYLEREYNIPSVLEVTVASLLALCNKHSSPKTSPD